MKRERSNHNYLRQSILGSLFFLFCLLSEKHVFAQSFVVSFPIGSTVYAGSQLPLTVVIAGTKCENTVIKCHKGLVSMTGSCQYLYRCKNVGVDTVEVLIRKGSKMIFVGQQVFEVKPPPLPRASIAGLHGGKIVKGVLQVQQGVGSEFYVAGNHWENCTIESFRLIILRDGELVASNRNDGYLFTNDTKAVLQQVQVGDTVLVTDIKGCAQQGGGTLESLEFKIE
jgi:hypothetical protein